MPDQKTIDRVAVGLAELAIHAFATLKQTGLWGLPHYRQTLPSEYRLLCLLVCIPAEPIPDWAERALADHHGTPEELVATLRELAGRAGPNAFARSLKRIENQPE